MPKARADDKILSYNDVVLRRSDLDILNGPYFLNDRIIEFYLSYLTSCHPSEQILLIPPSIAFWIKECPDTSMLQDFLEPLKFSQRKLIIFPVNDNDDVNLAEGGSHWSLLAFDRDANTFVHHDSSSMDMNSFHGKRIYRAVLPYTAANAGFVECSSTPKQVNGHDCGVYLTAIARAICQWHESCQPGDKENLWYSDLEKITPSFVSEMRYEILGIIKSLMETSGKS